MPKGFEGQIAIEGCWPRASSEEVAKVIDDAFHEASMCGCTESPTGTWYVLKVARNRLPLQNKPARVKRRIA